MNRSYDNPYKISRLHRFIEKLMFLDDKRNFYKFYPKQENKVVRHFTESRQRQSTSKYLLLTAMR